MLATIILGVLVFVFGLIAMYFVIEYMTALTLYEDLEEQVKDIINAGMELSEYIHEIEDENYKLRTQLRAATITAEEKEKEVDEA